MGKKKKKSVQYRIINNTHKWIINTCKFIYFLFIPKKFPSSSNLELIPYCMLEIEYSMVIFIMRGDFKISLPYKRERERERKR